MSDNEHLVHALRAAAVRWDDEIAAFGARHALGGTDVRALIALLDLERAGESATPGVLAGELGLSSAACTALVDRLAAAGLVGRAPDPADRRRVRLTVTDRARTLGEGFFRAFLGPIRAAAAALSPAEAQVVARFLGSTNPP
ncbi:MarR family winged helix-turn-helix transcriptional regulator [Tsukamurella pseudospumae]|uniref:MarR family transcriptional regulator n=1 Tax=Tsukamurella pseudospumae TaxID=239498 RepID=A0A138A8N9_9ACTN|nr:MarR family transcriptional regulator [Tsukamurella pseudospumae]KXO93975.1 MarR family transcriptional regulator [Tsukamurella pseudospumae]KXP06812.1 MarR family transcriptional regulator [Tsukamurella pseudospumae]